MQQQARISEASSAAYVEMVVVVGRDVLTHPCSSLVLLRDFTWPVNTGSGNQTQVYLIPEAKGLRDPLRFDSRAGAEYSPQGTEGRGLGQ